ncbi:hypothetical protein ACFWQL_11750 [Amycolatopsis thermoflava]|uniref:hypothetical protein n=1 Tax=Amycolatopsis thermoflava TaxID=84480 RepID=UPI003666D082
MIGTTYPSAPVDAETASLLRLIAGDPLHAEDRAAVARAILAAAAADGGRVDPNQVRKRIPATVYPRVIGAVYQALARAGVLQSEGWTISDDRRGRNSGRPARVYRMVHRAS